MGGHASHCTVVFQSLRKELSFPLCRSPSARASGAQRFIGTVMTLYALLCCGPFKLKLLLFNPLCSMTEMCRGIKEQRYAMANVHYGRTELNECNTRGNIWCNKIVEYKRIERVCVYKYSNGMWWFSDWSFYSTTFPIGRTALEANMISWVQLIKCSVLDTFDWDNEKVKSLKLDSLLI